MSLGVCRTCEKSIAVDAVYCPHCGETKPAKTYTIFSIPISYKENERRKIKEIEHNKLAERFEKVEQGINTAISVLDFIDTITGGKAKREKLGQEKEKLEQEKKAAQQRLKAWEKQQKKNLERAQDEIAEKQRRLKIAKDLTGSELNVDAINKLLLSNYWMNWSLCPGLTFATWIHVYNILKDNNISNSVYNKINLMYAVIYFIPLFLAFLHNGTASGNFLGVTQLPVMYKAGWLNTPVWRVG